MRTNLNLQPLERRILCAAIKSFRRVRLKKWKTSLVVFTSCASPGVYDLCEWNRKRNTLTIKYNIYKDNNFNIQGKIMTYDTKS